MHPIFQLQGDVTQLVVELQLQKLVRRFSYHQTNVGETFNVLT